MERERLDEKRERLDEGVKLNGAAIGKPKASKGSEGSKPVAGKNGGKATAPASEADSEADSQPLRPDLWPQPVDGKAVLFDLRRLLFDHIVMTEEQEMAVALWVLHAHAHDAARRSPILVITAPLPQCGKSNLLECLLYLVPRGWWGEDVSPASVFEAIDEESATILLDEADYMGSDRQMQRLINSTHSRTGSVKRKGRRYSTWAPVAIALNGHLHNTTESRAIIIRLERKLKDVAVKKAREPNPGDEKNPFNVLSPDYASVVRRSLTTMAQVARFA